MKNNKHLTEKQNARHQSENDVQSTPAIQSYTMGPGPYKEEPAQPGKGSAEQGKGAYGLLRRTPEEIAAQQKDAAWAEGYNAYEKAMSYTGEIDSDDMGFEQLMERVAPPMYEATPEDPFIDEDGRYQEHEYTVLEKFRDKEQRRH